MNAFERGNPNFRHGIDLIDGIENGQIQVAFVLFGVVALVAKLLENGADFLGKLLFGRGREGRPAGQER